MRTTKLDSMSVQDINEMERRLREELGMPAVAQLLSAYIAGRCLNPIVRVHYSDPACVADDVKEKLERRMRALAKFLDVASLERVDKGNSEELIITKDGVTRTIAAHGNRYDGGFFSLGFEFDEGVVSVTDKGDIAGATKDELLEATRIIREGSTEDAARFIDAAPDDRSRKARKALMFGVLYGMRGE